MRPTISSLCLLICLLLAAGPGLAPALAAAPQNQDQQQASEDLDHAYRALQDYTYAKKDEFLRWAQARKADLDRRIADLQTRIDAAGDKAKTNLKAARADLEKERGLLEKHLESLQKSGEKAWNDTKWGFSAAFDKVQQSYHRALSRFEDEQGGKNQ